MNIVSNKKDLIISKIEACRLLKINYKKYSEEEIFLLFKSNVDLIDRIFLKNPQKNIIKFLCPIDKESNAVFVIAIRSNYDVMAI